MVRFRPSAGVAAACLALTGCVGFFDTVTSRTWRNAPFGTTRKLISPDDPLTVVLDDPPRPGDERAKAMRRLKEPLAAGQPQEVQDKVVDLLARTATADPSPILRLAAIDALGRFEDPRAGGVLIASYNLAHGRPQGVDAPKRTPGDITQAALRDDPNRNFRFADRAMLNGPSGFAPDTVAAIRCRTLDSLSRTGKPEAVNFMAHVATAGDTENAPDGADDRDVRLAAVRGLGKVRQPEAVAALAKVLTRENGRDGAVVGRAHEGLVSLTGKKLPAEPAPWNEVVQAGAVVVPEPSWVETATGWFVP